MRRWWFRCLSLVLTAAISLQSNNSYPSPYVVFDHYDIHTRALTTLMDCCAYCDVAQCKHHTIAVNPPLMKRYYCEIAHFTNLTLCSSVCPSGTCQAVRTGQYNCPVLSVSNSVLTCSLTAKWTLSCTCGSGYLNQGHATRPLCAPTGASSSSTGRSGVSGTGVTGLSPMSHIVQ